MSGLTKLVIKEFSIRLFKPLGYTHSHAPHTVPDKVNCGIKEDILEYSAVPERLYYAEVMLREGLAP